ncbi:MAG: efflux RND transporter periplasmic adaptor subunit [Acidobacteria bacterium]|nr:efflux RND transporter periplasmic adaptor subunit [Acidobacteriota bacterium]
MSTTRVVLACLSALILNCHVPRMEAQAYCEEHQRNESVCPWCNADYVSELGICPEHGWQEAFCFRCHADLEPGFRAQGDWCVEHALPESQCDACGAQVPKLDLASNLPIETACPSVASVIVLPNVETAEKVGIQVAPVIWMDHGRHIEVPARTDHDQNHYVQVRARIAGLVTDVQVDLGQWVEAGNVIAMMESSAVAEWSAEYHVVRSHASLQEQKYKQDQRLWEQGLLAERDFLETENAWREATAALEGQRRVLTNHGMDMDLIEREGRPIVAIRAPLSGKVVSRAAVRGLFVAANEALFALADTQRMWLWLDVPRRDVQYLKKGLVVRYGIGLKVVESQVDWISSEIDSHTQTLRARAVLDNPEGLIRAGDYGRVELVLEEQAGLSVPKDAVQWEGCCQIVFTPDGNNRFKPVKVSILHEDQDAYLVAADLSAEAQVVTTGSFLLKTELMKESIGAGCCQAESGH